MARPVPAPAAAGRSGRRAHRRGRTGTRPGRYRGGRPRRPAPNADIPQLEVGIGGCERFLGVGAGFVKRRALARRRQDRALGERVRLPAAQENQRRLAARDPGVVGLNQHGAAVGLQPRRMLERRVRVDKPLRANRSRADRGFHHDLALGQPHPLAGGEESARHRGHAGLGEVGEIAFVGVPRHHPGALRKCGRAASRPGTPRAARCSPTSPQDHHVSVERFRVVQDSHRACSPRLRALRRVRRRRRHPPPAQGTRRAQSGDGKRPAGRASCGRIVSMHAIEVAQTGGPKS